MFLMALTTSRKKILSVNRKARRDLEQGTIPNIPIMGLVGGKEKVLLTIMKKYKIPQIKPNLI